MYKTLNSIPSLNKLKLKKKIGMMVHTCNPALGTPRRTLKVQSQHELYNETLSLSERHRGGKHAHYGPVRQWLLSS